MAVISVPFLFRSSALLAAGRLSTARAATPREELPTIGDFLKQPSVFSPADVERLEAAFQDLESATADSDEESHDTAAEGAAAPVVSAAEIDSIRARLRRVDEFDSASARDILASLGQDAARTRSTYRGLQQIRGYHPEDASTTPGDGSATSETSTAQESDDPIVQVDDPIVESRPAKADLKELYRELNLDTALSCFGSEESADDLSFDEDDGLSADDEASTPARYRSRSSTPAPQRDPQVEESGVFPMETAPPASPDSELSAKLLALHHASPVERLAKCQSRAFAVLSLAERGEIRDSSDLIRPPSPDRVPADTHDVPAEIQTAHPEESDETESPERREARQTWGHALAEAVISPHVGEHLRESLEDAYPQGKWRLTGRFSPDTVYQHQDETDRDALKKVLYLCSTGKEAEAREYWGEFWARQNEFQWLEMQKQTDDRRAEFDRKLGHAEEGVEVLDKEGWAEYVRERDGEKKAEDAEEAEAAAASADRIRLSPPRYTRVYGEDPVRETRREARSASPNRTAAWTRDLEEIRRRNAKAPAKAPARSAPGLGTATPCAAAGRVAAARGPAGRSSPRRAHRASPTLTRRTQAAAGPQRSPAAPSGSHSFKPAERIHRARSTTTVTLGQRKASRGAVTGKPTQNGMATWAATGRK